MKHEPVAPLAGLLGSKVATLRYPTLRAERGGRIDVLGGCDLEGIGPDTGLSRFCDGSGTIDRGHVDG